MIAPARFALSASVHGAALAALAAVAIPGGIAAPDRAGFASWIGEGEAWEAVEEGAVRPDLAEGPAPTRDALPAIPDVPEEYAWDEPAPPAPCEPMARWMPERVRRDLPPPSEWRLAREVVRPASAGAPPPPSAVASAPRLVSGAAPVYPAAAAAAGVAGLVILRIRIASDGTAAEICVLASSGSRELDDVALAAARDWAFEPPRVRGEPVEAWVEVPVRFRLE